ncbi:MAG: hypothetical protein RL701_1503 [Pseudomonadota bacterium]
MKAAAWIALALALILLATLELMFGFSKFVVLAYLRLTAPSELPLIVEPPLTHPIVVAFDATPSSPELFAPETAQGAVGLPAGFADGVWSRYSRHQLLLRVGQVEPVETITSFATHAQHRARRVQNVTFHPFTGHADYHQTLNALEQLFERLHLTDHIDWSDYERRLDVRPIDHLDTSSQLTTAKLFLSLGCDWDEGVVARRQLSTVKCHPVITVEANEQ